ncbi:MAG: hypothetical protein WC707_01670 [Candidatus Babeliaceae bacterium]|jgi:hypothetical protein
MKNYTILSLLLVVSGLTQAMGTSIFNSKKLKKGLFGKFNAAILSQNFNVPGSLTVEEARKPYSFARKLALLAKPDEVVLTDGNDATIIKKEYIKNSKTLTELTADVPIDQHEKFLTIYPTIDNEVALLARALKFPIFDNSNFNAQSIEKLFGCGYMWNKYKIGTDTITTQSILDKIYDRMTQIILEPSFITSHDYIEKVVQLNEKYNAIEPELTARILASHDFIQMREYDCIDVPAKLVYDFENTVTAGDIPYSYYGTNDLVISSDNKKLFTTLRVNDPDFPFEDPPSLHIAALDLEKKMLLIQRDIMLRDEKILGTTPDSTTIITYNCRYKKLKAYDMATLQENSDGCEFFNDTNSKITFSHNETKFVISHDKSSLLQLNPAPEHKHIVKRWNKQLAKIDVQSLIDLKFAHCDIQTQEQAQRLAHLADNISHVTPDGTKFFIKNTVYQTSNGKPVCTITDNSNITFSTKDFIICNNYAPNTIWIKSLITGKTLAILKNAEFVDKFIISSDNKIIYGIKYEIIDARQQCKEQLFAWELHNENVKRYISLKKALHMVQPSNIKTMVHKFFDKWKDINKPLFYQQMHSTRDTFLPANPITINLQLITPIRPVPTSSSV